MSMDTTRGSDASLFGRLISRQRPAWITVGIGCLLLLAPIGAAALDGVLDELFQQEGWRLLFLAPAVIVYILVVSPLLARMEARVVHALRPVVLVDDEAFTHLVDEASRLNPIGEGVSFGAGAALGLWIGRAWLSGAEAFWLGLWLPLSAALMFGLLGWTIYAAIASTHLTAALHRQPLSIDLFNLKPFEPVGRQSLSVALVFIAGILLAVSFGVSPQYLLTWQNLLLICFMALVPILIFFLNMRYTHGVLAAEKQRELEQVQPKLRRACRALIEQIDTGESIGTLAAEINALVAYEQRLQAARTWPYDTAMLRTLFVSVIIPIVVAVARIVSELKFD